MKNNIKRFFIGLFIGILLLSNVSVFAEPEEYIFQASNCKLIINNTEYTNPDIPTRLFVYEERNYIPLAVLKDLCLQIGINFEYNNEIKEIKIDTSNLDKINQEKIKEIVKNEIESAKRKFTTPEFDENKAEIIEEFGFRGIMWDVEFYVPIENILNNPVNPNLKIEKTDNIYIVTDTKLNEQIELTNSVVGYGYGYITYKNKDYLGFSKLAKFIPLNKLEKTISNSEKEQTKQAAQENKNEPFSSDGIELLHKFNNKNEIDLNGESYIYVHQIIKKYKKQFNYIDDLVFCQSINGKETIFNPIKGEKYEDAKIILSLYDYTVVPQKCLLKNIPNIEGKFIPLDYYENKILPIIKQRN